MTNPLCDKVAIITGASSGIGEAVARRLARSGTRVVLAARRLDRLNALRASLEADDGTALVVATDVTDRTQVDALARTAVDAYGGIDILINNAGIMPLSPLRRLRVEEWEQMVDVNIKGVMFCIAAVLPSMLRRGRGHIVNLSSLASRRPFPGGSVYSATKFAVRSLSAGLRLELSPTDKIRVTDIEPGVVDTELADHISDEDSRARFHEAWGDRRKLTPDDVAETIIFVLSQPDRVNMNEVLVRPTDQAT